MSDLEDKLVNTLVNFIVERSDWYGERTDIIIEKHYNGLTLQQQQRLENILYSCQQMGLLVIIDRYEHDGFYSNYNEKFVFSLTTRGKQLITPKVIYGRL